MGITAVQLFSLPVADQDRSLAFYVGVLGFELVADVPMGPGMRWTQVRPARWHDIHHPGDLVEHHGSGIDQGTVLETDDLDVDIAHFRSRGVDIPVASRMPRGGASSPSTTPTATASCSSSRPTGSTGPHRRHLSRSDHPAPHRRTRNRRHRPDVGPGEGSAEERTMATVELNKDNFAQVVSTTTRYSSTSGRRGAAVPDLRGRSSSGRPRPIRIWCSGRSTPRPSRSWPPRWDPVHPDADDPPRAGDRVSQPGALPGDALEDLISQAVALDGKSAPAIAGTSADQPAGSPSGGEPTGPPADLPRPQQGPHLRLHRSAPIEEANGTGVRRVRWRVGRIVRTTGEATVCTSFRINATDGTSWSAGRWSSRMPWGPRSPSCPGGTRDRDGAGRSLQVVDRRPRRGGDGCVRPTRVDDRRHERAGAVRVPPLHAGLLRLLAVRGGRSGGTDVGDRCGGLRTRDRWRRGRGHGGHGGLRCGPTVGPSGSPHRPI